MMLEGRAIGRCREIEGNAGAGIAHALCKRCCIRRRGHQRLMCNGKAFERLAGARCTDCRGWQHDLAHVVRRTHRMRPQPIRNFSRDTTQRGLHRREVDRNLRVLNRCRHKQRHHQIDVVVQPANFERRAVLPCGPDGAQRKNVLTNPRRSRRPGHAEPARDVATHLRAQPQGVPPVRQFLQAPRRHRRDIGTAREGNGNRRTEVQRLCGLRCQREHLKRIVLGFFDDQTREAQRFYALRVGKHSTNVERDLRCAQPGINFAQRQECFDFHRRSVEATGRSEILTITLPRLRPLST